MINRFSKSVAVIAVFFFAQLHLLAQEKPNAMKVLPNKGTPVKGVAIHQEVDFTTSPRLLYNALLDSKQFSAFSGRGAKIDSIVGNSFSVFDGHIIGRNVELVPNQRIVQAWRVADWPEGVYSIVKFEFKSQTSGTHLVFDHTGFPVELRDHLAAGWKMNYWDLLTKYFHK